MQTIQNIVVLPTQGSYYYEDVTALQNGEITHRWSAPGVTAGFNTVREIADTISIGIQTSEGLWAWGDAVSVSYAGKSGRSGLFRHASGMDELNGIVHNFQKETLDSFRRLASFIPPTSHNAIAYGFSQALLQAVALTQRKEMSEVIANEWNLLPPRSPVALQGSSGNDRILNAEKMIVNRLEALPQSQIDDIPQQLGLNGERLLSYAHWLAARVKELSKDSYFPWITLDVHGAIGKIFQNDIQKISTYLIELEKAVYPFSLRMESVLLGESALATVELLKQLKTYLKVHNSNVKICADEWANTLEDILLFAETKACDMIHIKMPDLGNLTNTIDAVLGCKKFGMGTLLGGSCIETEISLKASVHVALATQPDFFLAKPGMGVDEAIMLTRNEMNRALAILTPKNVPSP